ncbi:hypothetical protein B9Z55_012039 [Caenorhabditis nigoni]|uniref:Uncharacterized protein n=1 Tax=Caenorhabditis nigoni TaxID=1611254 RepID=A0A2G5TVJ3_9PELO|nr:hypothetical protein B9Z55_012039 [Caenorhabditis nigoni]
MSQKKETNISVDPFSDQDVLKTKAFSWREIHLQMFFLTIPLPLFFIVTGILQFYWCDVSLAIWMIIMGIMIGVELIHVSVFFHRATVQKNETDLEDDDIFDHYEPLKDPIVKRIVRIHSITGLLSYFGGVKCYLILIGNWWCSGMVFWPSLLISLFYWVTMAALVVYTCKSKNRKMII